MEESINTYQNILGFKTVSDIFTITEQKVKVCFVELSSNVFIELIEPLGENSTFNRFLKVNNPYYHLGYLVDHFDGTIKQLQERGLHLVNIFNSEAFNQQRCAFLYTEDMHLIEIIENQIALS